MKKPEKADSSEVFKALTDTETLIAIRWDKLTGDYNFTILGMPIKVSTLTKLVATIMKEAIDYLGQDAVLTPTIPDHVEIQVEEDLPPWIKKQK